MHCLGSFYIKTVAKSDIQDVHNLVQSTAMGHLICQPCHAENTKESFDESISGERDVEKQTLDHEDPVDSSSGDCHTSSIGEKRTENVVPYAHQNADDVPSKSRMTVLDSSISNLAEKMVNTDSYYQGDNKLSDLTDTFEDGESPEFVLIPMAGRVAEKYNGRNSESSNDGIRTDINEAGGCRDQHRHVFNGCTICLTRIVAGEQVSWSSNDKCLHIFHFDCILNWFLAVGRKVQQRRLRDRLHEVDPNNTEHRVQICTFPMLCPCCRQQFVILPESIDKEKESSDRTEAPSFDESIRHSIDGEMSDNTVNLDIEEGHQMQEQP